MKTKTLRNITYGIISMIIALAVSETAIGQPCQRWDASGIWKLIQSNKTYVVVNLKQSGDVINGYAHAYDFGKTLGYHKLEGKVDGTIKGNRFSVQIYWKGQKSVGVYKGEIEPSGRINGPCYDRFDPGNKAEWDSEGQMKCL